MKSLGIDDVQGDVYENVGAFFRIILPSPVLTDAILDPTLPLRSDVFVNPARTLFREDSFDTTSRVRRGRFYVFSQSTQQQPAQSRVMPYPIGAHMVGGGVQVNQTAKMLFVYDQYRLHTPTPKFVAIGSDESLWQVVYRPERISTGEFLFTLKARHAFGILPELDDARIPDFGVSKVKEALAMLIDAVHRESPASIVDRARDATQSCLATWAASELNDSRLILEDLGPLLQKLKTYREMVAFRAAEIIQRLHSRGKPNEQARYGARPPMEDDSDLAVKAVAFIIREIGWALGEPQHSVPNLNA